MVATSSGGECLAKFCVFFFYRPTGRPRRTSLPLECHRNKTTRTCFRLAAFYQSFKHNVGLAAAKAASVRINLNIEGCGIVAPTMHAPSPTHFFSPSFFTQSPFPPRSLVRDGQTSPHRPRFVVSHSTCPPLPPFPHANSFVMGTAVINNNVKHGSCKHRILRGGAASLDLAPSDEQESYIT
jgi:hypothetical protein